jgi:hypothetical protein
MKKLEPSREDFTRSLIGMSDRDFYASMYNLSIGETFVHLSLLEDVIIQAMTTCDRIKIKSKLEGDAEAWQILLEKRSVLQDSTLGSLISILERHEIKSADIGYLRWVKQRRDFFVHRFFHDGRWPGDIHEDDARFLIRQLLYLKVVFWRASDRIWKILASNGFMIRQDLGADGALMINIGSFFDPEAE